MKQKTQKLAPARKNSTDLSARSARFCNSAENKSDLCKAAMSKSRTDFAPQVNILRLDANDVLFCANRWWYNLIIWICLLLLLLPLMYYHQKLCASDMEVFKAVENLQCFYRLHSVKTWCLWIVRIGGVGTIWQPGHASSSAPFDHQKLFASDIEVFRAVVRNQVMGTGSYKTYHGSVLFCRKFISN